MAQNRSTRGPKPRGCTSSGSRNRLLVCAQLFFIPLYVLDLPSQGKVNPERGFFFVISSGLASYIAPTAAHCLLVLIKPNGNPALACHVRCSRTLLLGLRTFGKFDLDRGRACRTVAVILGCGLTTRVYNPMVTWQSTHVRTSAPPLPAVRWIARGAQGISVFQG